MSSLVLSGFGLLFGAAICTLPLVWGVPLENSRSANTDTDTDTDADAGSSLGARLQGTGHTVLARQDSTLLDPILQTNAELGLDLFEGDIRGVNPRHRIVATKPLLWTNGMVPYIIDPRVNETIRGYIHGAIAEFHNETCVRWTPRTTERDYIIFRMETGCHSQVGRAVSGGPQEVSLMSECASLGTAIHEMLHVLGFYHEHTRPDRDSWVEVMMQNVMADKEANFFRLPASAVHTTGVQYDYSSVLHYSRFAFTFNGQPTLLPKRDPYATLGQREGFSAGDLFKVNLLYECHADMDGAWGAWSEWSMCAASCGESWKYRYRKCDNPPPSGQGQPCQGHDREVTSCNLGSCQGASHCGVPHRVGLPGTSGSIDIPSYDNYMNCRYVILARSPDVTINVTVTRLDIEQSAGCAYDALQIYDGTDSRTGRLLGSFCGQNPGTVPPLRSSGPSVYVRFSSDGTTTGGGFTLRYVFSSGHH